jgi:hypothetical protein
LPISYTCANTKANSSSKEKNVLNGSKFQLKVFQGGKFKGWEKRKRGTDLNACSGCHSALKYWDVDEHIAELLFNSLSRRG